MDLGRRQFLRAAGTAIVGAPLARLTFLNIGALAATPVEFGAAEALIRADLLRVMEAMKAQYITGPFTLVMSPSMSGQIKALNWNLPHVVSQPITVIADDEEVA